MPPFFELDQRQGLYRKYHVERLNDPEGKHDECPMYVLDLVHDRHARNALAAYIQSCQEDYPDLASDLAALLDDVIARGLDMERE